MTLFRIVLTAVCLAACMGQADAESSYVYRLKFRLSRDSKAVSSDARQGISDELRAFNRTLEPGVPRASSLWSYRTGRDVIYLFQGPESRRVSADRIKKVPGVIGATLTRLMKIEGELALCRVTFDVRVRLKKNTRAGNKAKNAAKEQMDAIRGAYSNALRLHYDFDDNGVDRDGNRRYAEGDVKAYLILSGSSRSRRTVGGVTGLSINRLKDIQAE